MNLHQIYIPALTLRSSSLIFLVLARICLNSMGSRAFHYAASHLRISLPLDIRNLF